MKYLVLAEAGVETSVSVLYKVLQKSGAVALVPTETVYGLIANASDEAAIRKIFELKRRPVEKKIGWFAGNIEMVKRAGVLTDGLPEQLAREYMPGALTLIAPCRNGDTQGFRIPDHPLLFGLLNKIGAPLVQTSANASGNPDAKSCMEALQQLAGEVDCAIDGGSLLPGARGSTVADVTGEKVKILRQGAVDLTKWH